MTGIVPSSSTFSTPGSAAMAKVCRTCGVHYPAEFKVCPRDATALDDAAGEAERDELVGKTLNQTYTVIRVIGEGGMGRVYEAQHTRLRSKRFAVKMLHPEFARRSEVIARFQREAEAAASIQSPYVVGVYDVDRAHDGRPFLVGELLEGKEFGDHLEEVGRMAVAPAVRVVRHICKALTAAHAKGVVHRDMKPENVFLTGDLLRPTAKVIDFGISKIGDAPGTALTQTGMIMGTPSYMAPEQALGEKVDHRADIYAVGAILYCSLTGSRPFDRDDPTATLTALLTQDPPSPRSIEPSIPQALEMIIQRAMAKRPADRYETMAELDAQLAPYDLLASELDIPQVSSTPNRSLGGHGSTDPRGATRSGRQARESERMRPLVLLLSGLGASWIVGTLISTIAAIVRMMRGRTTSATLTGSESALLILGVTFTFLMPVLLAVRYVSREIWADDGKVATLADRLQRPVVVGLCAYGFASLLVRVIELVIVRKAVGVAWPVWELILFVIGAIAALGALADFEMERKHRR